MKKIFAAVADLSLTAKAITGILFVVFCLSGIMLLWRLNNHFLILVPMSGGAITQAVVGAPQFINPVLAVTDADNDLAALVYSGLLRYGPSGILIPDLAQSYSVSPDGLTYDFIIKKNAKWSDGQPLTADDIVFTISKIQDPAMKSPQAANWQGVSVQKISDDEVVFTLPRAYTPFVGNFTAGILPEHIWSTISDQDFTASPFNTHPIGSGPYEIIGITTTPGGAPISYTLGANLNFALGRPFINTVTLKFYADENDAVAAYQAGDVTEISGIMPATVMGLVADGSVISTSTLPRVFGIFFNQNNNPVLADQAVRQALDMSTDKVYIVNTVLHGLGEPINQPVPPDLFGTAEGQGDKNSPAESSSTLSITPTAGIADTVAAGLLDKDGWALDPTSGTREKKVGQATTTLAFSISTPDVPELIGAADDLRDEWQNIGIDVTVKVFDGGYLDENIIGPRDYDSLLFGENLGKSLDLAPFWSSSQKNAPGLNIAMYSNKTVDAAVSAMQVATSTQIKNELYEAAVNQINKDIPAIFLYAPETMYLSDQPLHTGDLTEVSGQSDQFNNIYDWYINTEKVWRIFSRWYR